MLETINYGLYDNMKGQFKFYIDYKYTENQLNIESIDLRPVNIQNGDSI